MSPKRVLAHERHRQRADSVDCTTVTSARPDQSTVRVVVDPIGELCTYVAGELLRSRDRPATFVRDVPMGARTAFSAGTAASWRKSQEQPRTRPGIATHRLSRKDT